MSLNLQLSDGAGDGDRAVASPMCGDPNTKNVRLTLTVSEWRELRLRAARDLSSMQQIISEIVRRELDRGERPGSTNCPARSAPATFLA